MDKSLTFFRVFDLAFFAPGAVLLSTLGWLYLPTTRADLALNSARGILTVIMGLAGIYVLGLLCHGVVRCVRWALKGFQRGAGTPLPFLLETNDLQSNLVLYFWYLRATCWNLSVALLFSLLIVASAGRLADLGGWANVAVGSVVLAAVLALWLGFEFDGSLQKCKQQLRRRRPVAVRRIRG